MGKAIDTLEQSNKQTANDSNKESSKIALHDSDKESEKESVSVEREVVNRLKARKLVISTAESCTGGMIASSIVNIPGASSVFKEGYVTYSDEVKHKLLHVRKSTLKKYTAVSKETAEEMAFGCAKRTGSDLSVAVTGVAGPDTEDGKPVGLVYVSCYYQSRVHVNELHLKGTRSQIREQAANKALELVLDVLD